jgi:hypothetical protein
MANLEDYATDKSYIKFLYKCLYDLHNMLLDNGISYYADGGTLLGQVRHKGIINVDDDVDLCISYKDVHKILSPSFKKLLKSKGYYVKLHSESGKKARNGLVYDWLKINSKKKVSGRISSIDLFTVYLDTDDNGKLRTYFESDFCRNEWGKNYHYLSDLLPLRQCKFGKGIVFTPKAPKKYLDRSYGKNWSKVMYVTQDRNHMMLDQPIKIKMSKFKPAGDLADARDQRLVGKSNILLTMTGNNLL